jgi:hypothetical protein
VPDVRFRGVDRRAAVAQPPAVGIGAEVGIALSDERLAAVAGQVFKDRVAVVVAEVF